MGVAGCGKSSVGAGLVEEGVCTYIDGDDLHSAASIQKMAQGIALTDKDREPWLKRVGETLTKTDGVVVIACSALKRKYREYIIQSAGETVGFLHLVPPKMSLPNACLYVAIISCQRHCWIASIGIWNLCKPMKLDGMLIYLHP